MKLIVPCLAGMEAVDTRLMRLAEFLGITCEPLPLNKPAAEFAVHASDAISRPDACLVVCPRVFKKWTDGCISRGLLQFLFSGFRYLLVHAPEADPFDASLIAELSGGHFGGVEGTDASESYEISPDSKDVTEAFAGISFGPVNPANDRVFRTGASSLSVRTHISIGGRAMMAAVNRENSKVLFLAGADVVDLDAEAGDKITDYFSRLMPYAMALRSIFSEESWRPCPGHACVIVDDPLLRQTYGFLSFEKLLEMMKHHGFHTTIAFIPHNFRRTSAVTGNLLRENPGYFSLCFHGNDHTGAEFASTDTTLLKAMLQTAERRISAHGKTTGLDCDRVMVFPQGNFSVEAMSVLQARNFDCAVNTCPYPKEQVACVTFRELAQPALLRYAGLPLFLRSKSSDISNEGIAFDLFFGRPVLIVEHHDAFRDPQPLLEAVSKINSVAPGIHWSNPANAASRSFSRRLGEDGEHQIRAYSRTVLIKNEENSTARFAVEWNFGGDGARVENVLVDGIPGCAFESNDSRVRVVLDVPASRSQSVSLFYGGDTLSFSTFGFRYHTRAFLRRRLSEIRDNYLSKSQPVLTAAKTVQSFFSRVLT